MESMIQKKKKCYICLRWGDDLERHHCIHGTANRRQAEKYGLWVWLCPECHRRVHSAAGHELDVELKKTAQSVWEASQGDTDAFRRVFGKSWL